MVSATASTTTNGALVIVPAVITVCGVLIVGASAAWLNRRIHLDRLTREEVVVRREAMTHHLAIHQEKPSVELFYAQAYERWKNVIEYIDSNTFADTDKYRVQALRSKMDEKIEQAVLRRDDWSIRAGAAQYAAMATISDVTSPLVMTAKIPVNIPFSHPDHVAAIDLFIDALRVDAIINKRKRQKAEKVFMSRLKKRLPREVLLGKTAQVAPTSPPGAGHHTTHNEPTS